MTKTDRKVETGSQTTARRSPARTHKEASPRKVSAMPARPQGTGEPTQAKPVPKRGRAAPAKAAPVAAAPKDTPRPTKKQACLALLGRAEGASIEEMQLATGWQAHTVRGFLSGEVRKRMGRQLESETTEGGERRYRISGAGTGS